MLRRATPRSARSTNVDADRKNPALTARSPRDASSCATTSSHAVAILRRRRVGDVDDAVRRDRQRRVQLVHAELVYEISEGVEVRVVLGRRRLQLDDRLDHLLPVRRARHEARHGVTVGHRRAVLVHGPVLDLVAAHGAQRHDVSTSVGRSTIGDTGAENQRSITPTPASSITDRAAGSSSCNGSSSVARARSASARSTGQSASIAWRSSRSTADTSDRGVRVVVDQQRDRGLELDVAAVPATVGDEALVGRQQHLDHRRLDVGAAQHASPATVDRGLDEIDDDERPLQTPARVTDAPRRAAHDALVPQAGERGEVGQHRIEIVDHSPMSR